MAAEVDERLEKEEATALSPEERSFADAALAGLTPELRAKVSELDLITTVRGYQTYQPRLEETNKALKAIMEWREKVHYDRFLKERLARDVDFHKMWPESVYGEDKYGHVVTGFRFSEISVEGLDSLKGADQSSDADSEASYLLRLQGQKITMLMRYKQERAHALGLQRYKHIIVVDLSGLGMGILSGHTRATIKQVMDVSANYFPESAWKIFLVNSPFVFRAAWAVVKPWIHPITAAKINIFGSVKDAVKKMAELGIPASSIPKWGGGTHDGLPIIDLLLKEISQSDEALGKKLEQAADLHSV